VIIYLYTSSYVFYVQYDSIVMLLSYSLKLEFHNNKTNNKIVY